MLKFKLLTRNLLRTNLCLSNLNKPSSYRNFCQKLKNEESANTQTSEQVNDQEETQQAKRHWYTYLRKFRKFLMKLIKYGFYTYTTLLLGNYLIYKQNATVVNNLSFIKMDHFQRVIYTLLFMKQTFMDTLTLPYSSRLLPDNIDTILSKKKTLVLNLNKTLVDWNYAMGTGFEIVKRPGLAKFLQELSEHYEIVVFDTMDSMFIEQLCDILDPFKTNIFYKLGKEATRLEKGKYIKDLRFLNRDLSKVLVLDFDPESAKYNPENLIIVPEYSGDTNDRELVHMIHFLIALSKPTVKDVRQELNKYGHFKPHIKFYKSDKKYSKLVPTEYQDKDIIDDDYGKNIKKV